MDYKTRSCEQGDDLVRRLVNDTVLTGNGLPIFREELVASTFSVAQEG